MSARLDDNLGDLDFFLDALTIDSGVYIVSMVQPRSSLYPCREREDRPDRSQLIISDQDGVMVGRLPGQLNGRQFKIQNCKDSRIFVLDHTDTVTVDKCNNCQIVIGPSRGRYSIKV